MLSAAGRFLTELDAVEGPPLGVLTGLAMAGIPPTDVLAALRDMFFGFHDRIADGAPVCVEKTGTDIFHLDTLEPLLAGHAGFVCITRNPLDVVASNMDLARTMGAQLTELYSATRGTNSECDGIARAWIDRQQALDAFAARSADACVSLRYEDLLADPPAVLARLLAFIGLQGDPEAMIAAAFSLAARIGLGDFRIDETSGLRPVVDGGWRKRLPRAAAARILPQLAPLMAAHGYTVPRLPAPPDRDTAIRQFQLATQMKRQTRTAAVQKPHE